MKEREERRKTVETIKTAAVVAFACTTALFSAALLAANHALDAVAEERDCLKAENELLSAENANLRTQVQFWREVDEHRITIVQDYAVYDTPAGEETARKLYLDAIPLTAEEQTALAEAADTYGVGLSLMLGLIERETQFRNVYGDSRQSVGYCQIQPRWWSGLMAEIGTTELTDPRDNFLTAAAILRQLKDNYGTWERALTAYNTGSPGKSAYATSVLKNAEK